MVYSAKNKNKDDHLPSIDVNFASNYLYLVCARPPDDSRSDVAVPRSCASLTLAYSRQYGLIGRSGEGHC